MNRTLYSLLWWPATPVLMLYLCWRARAQSSYLHHWAQRWAVRWPSVPKDRAIVWIHAVSVGETRAAAPLIAAMLSRFPSVHIVLSHGTPTGKQTGEQIFATEAARVTSVYLPYDYAFAGRRFLAHFKPLLGVVLETEVWPNLMHTVSKLKVPLVLANGRLSEKSLGKALRQRALMVPALKAFQVVLAQTADDARRLQMLGVASQVIGNLKFDMKLDVDAQARGLRWAQGLGGKKVILLASSREGEERLCLDAIASHSTPIPADVMLAIVPRHPQRFDEVAELIKGRGYTLSRRTEASFPQCLENTVLLGDSMGELQAFYALADIVIMGGTLAGTGGQNLIEAAALGCPVVLGPSVYNFAQASELAMQAGAAFGVNDAVQAWSKALQLAANEPERKKASDAALTFSHQHKGALTRTLSELEKLLLLERST